MSADAFDRLLYTDCRPGAGRDGSGGFQVQAQSSGVDLAQARQATGTLLYEVQHAWIVERRPVPEFPLGLAHVADPDIGYGTAQSRYLGKEATGGRQGNHLADCLLTRDPELYGTIRPVQMWGASFWRGEPWPAVDCPPLPADDLGTGPLAVDAVAAWTRVVAGRGPVLARLLSVLEDPRGRRVVIVADDPADALTWIAAATLLLPARHALDISFKVFTSDPVRSRHRVVAAPASLNPDVAPGRVPGAFVLDAAACASDEGPASRRALFLVGEFTGEADPYDVVEAVELAGQLARSAPGSPLGDDLDPLYTAWALIRPGDPLPDPRPLFRWLTGASAERFAAHGSAVARLILPTAPAGMLRWLDGAVAAGRLDLPGVRTALRHAELAAVADGHEPPPGVLPDAGLNDAGRRDAESELSSAILDAADGQVDLLLRLARRHGIDLEVAARPLRTRLHAFAVSLVDHPGRYRPDRWALRDVILDCAHDELGDRMARNGIRSVRGVIGTLHPYFTDRADLSDDLDLHLQAAGIAALPSRERGDRLDGLLGVLAALPPGKAMTDTAARLQRALADWDAIDPDLAVTILDRMPRPATVAPEIAEAAASRLRWRAAKPDPELLDLLTRLNERGRLPQTAEIGSLAWADRQVSLFTSRAVQERITTDEKFFEGTIGVVASAQQSVVQARLDAVLGACLASPRSDLGSAVLSSLPGPLRGQLVSRWCDTLGSRDRVQDGVWCVACVASPDPDPLMKRHVTRIITAVREHAGQLPVKDRDSWFSGVQGRLTPDQRAVWKAIFSQEDKPRTILRANRDGRS